MQKGTLHPITGLKIKGNGRLLKKQELRKLTSSATVIAIRFYFGDAESIHTETEPGEV